YWVAYLPANVNRPALDVQFVTRAAQTLRQIALGLVELKEQAILEAVPRSSEYVAALQEYVTAGALVTTYNEAIRTFATAIAAKKSELASGDLARQEREL